MRTPAPRPWLGLCRSLPFLAGAAVPSQSYVPKALAEVQVDQQKSGKRGPFLPNVRRPVGVNLGGWLCLEDWFFSGPSGRHVATENIEGQGACLPPLLPHSEQPWPSEGILVQRLTERLGAAKTVEIFEAHRHSFVEDSDLRKIAELGVRTVRVPLNWVAFAHALAPIAPAVYGAHNPDIETVVVPDPFYFETASFVTIPNNWLKELLVRGNGYGLKFLLDLHAFPGGSSDGTYNGVWPKTPVFWNSSCRIGNTSVSLQTAGYLIVKGLTQWAESLTGPARTALAGVTLMNEPAHMSALNGMEPPFARPEQVLHWLGNATNMFMSSSLPDRGVKLYMNLIGTAFPAGVFYNMTVPWWNGLLSKEVRNSQAVFDVHWYAAWNGAKGAVGNVPVGVRALCDQPVKEIRGLLGYEVQSYAEELSSWVDGLKSCSEFSVGTNQDALLACDDLDVTNSFLDVQVEVMSNYSIDGFFWSWKMPYGPTFERGWSLKVNADMQDLPEPHPCSLVPSIEEQRQKPGLVLMGGGPFFVHGPGALAGRAHKPSELWANLVRTVYD